MQKVEFGDIVKVITTDKTYKGAYIDSYNKEIIILKQDSGYNLGIIKKGIKSLPSNISLPDIDNVKIAKAKEGGCEACNFTGYRGRQGLFEAFLVDSQMEKFILTNPPVSAVRELAVKKGMVTMYQSGLIDIISGVTTLEEVLRVVEEDESIEPVTSNP